MNLDEYDIVKLYDKLDYRDVYVSILKINGNALRVKVLNQPSHNLSVKRFSDSIFKQYCRPDDEEWDIPLDFNVNEMTLNVNSYMCQELSSKELIDLLKHLTYINFSKTLTGQVIIAHGLDKLIK